MIATKTRILKEARTLFWPWCAVSLLGAVNLLPFEHQRKDFRELFSIVGFFAGMPLLAVLSFGNEFQYKTISLLLTEPVDRQQIWREKLVVMLAAVFSACLVYYIGWRQLLDQSFSGWVLATGFLIAAVSSATFWTLIARSAIGGTILGGAVPYLVLAFGITFSDAAMARHYDPTEMYPVLRTVFAIFVLYSVVMIWLGHRKLLRFEAKGDVASHDLMTRIPSVLPKSLDRWVSWKPSGPALNLMRKEIHLLQPVWLLTLLWIALTVCIGLLRLFQIREIILGEVAGLLVGSYMLLMGTLAGVVSMGEERQSGTHSWHLTLPVSLLRQWAVKLVVILAASFICGVAVLGTASISVGPVFQDAVEDFFRGNVLEPLFGVVLLLTIPAFWCACAVKGTVRAAALIIPAWLAIVFTAAATSFFLESPSANSVMEYLVRAFHALTVPHVLRPIVFDPMPVIHFLETVALLLVLFQSYRLFRLERSEDITPIARPLIQLCVIVFLFAFCSGVITRFVMSTYFEEYRVAREVGETVDKLDLNPAALDAAHPLPVTVEDLNKVAPLSEMSRAWLSDARITILPKPATPVRTIKNGKWQELNAKYAAHLDFRNGTECKVYDVRTFCRHPGEVVSDRLWKSLY
jgi:ABC-type transport system involved in multi-copper enzyme maturation permease subunit